MSPDLGDDGGRPSDETSPEAQISARGALSELGAKGPGGQGGADGASTAQEGHAAPGGRHAAPRTVAPDVELEARDSATAARSAPSLGDWIKVKNRATGADEEDEEGSGEDGRGPDGSAAAAAAAAAEPTRRIHGGLRSLFRASGGSASDDSSEAADATATPSQLSSSLPAPSAVAWANREPQEPFSSARAPGIGIGDRAGADGSDPVPRLARPPSSAGLDASPGGPPLWHRSWGDEADRGRDGREGVATRSADGSRAGSFSLDRQHRSAFAPRAGEQGTDGAELRAGDGARAPDRVYSLSPRRSADSVGRSALRSPSRPVPVPVPSPIGLLSADLSRASTVDAALPPSRSPTQGPSRASSRNLSSTLAGLDASSSFGAPSGNADASSTFGAPSANADASSVFGSSFGSTHNLSTLDGESLASLSLAAPALARLRERLGVPPDGDVFDDARFDDATDDGSLLLRGFGDEGEYAGLGGAGAGGDAGDGPGAPAVVSAAAPPARSAARESIFQDALEDFGDEDAFQEAFEVLPEPQRVRLGRLLERRIRWRAAALLERRLGTAAAVALDDRIGRMAARVLERRMGPASEEALARAVGPEAAGSLSGRRRAAALLKLRLDEFLDKQREPLRTLSRDKLTFVLGSVDLWISAFWLGSSPETFYVLYTVKAILLLSIRWIVYRYKRWHYYLFDLCYAVQGLTLYQIWRRPASIAFAKLVFALNLGPLLWSIIAFRNSLVYHSLDKMTSHFLHWFPACVSYANRWHPPRAMRERLEADPAFRREYERAGLRDLFLLPLAPYALWCVIYWLKVFVFSKTRIRERGYMTLYEYVTADRRNFFGAFVLRFPRKVQPQAYMFLHVTLVVLTTLSAALWWRYKLASEIFLMCVFAASANSAASFYFEVFSRRYAQETGLDKIVRKRRAAKDKAKEAKEAEDAAKAGSAAEATDENPPPSRDGPSSPDAEEKRASSDVEAKGEGGAGGADDVRDAADPAPASRDVRDERSLLRRVGASAAAAAAAAGLDVPPSAEASTTEAGANGGDRLGQSSSGTEAAPEAPASGCPSPPASDDAWLSPRETEEEEAGRGAREARLLQAASDADVFGQALDPWPIASPRPDTGRAAVRTHQPRTLTKGHHD